MSRILQFSAPNYITPNYGKYIFEGLDRNSQTWIGLASRALLLKEDRKKRTCTGNRSSRVYGQTAIDFCAQLNEERRSSKQIKKASIPKCLFVHLAEKNSKVLFKQVHFLNV